MTVLAEYDRPDCTPTRTPLRYTHYPTSLQCHRVYTACHGKRALFGVRAVGLGGPWNGYFWLRTLKLGYGWIAVPAKRPVYARQSGYSSSDLSFIPSA